MTQNQDESKPDLDQFGTSDKISRCMMIVMFCGSSSLHQGSITHELMSA